MAIVILRRWRCVTSFWRRITHSHSAHVRLIALREKTTVAFTLAAFGHNLVEWHQSKHMTCIILNPIVNFTKRKVNWLMDLFTGMSPGARWAWQISVLPGQSRPSDCWCRQRKWRNADLRRPQQPWQWGHESCKHGVQGEVSDPGRWLNLSLENKFSKGNPLCVQGLRLWEPPPNSQGLAALLLLNILENFPLKGTPWVWQEKLWFLNVVSNFTCVASVKLESVFGGATLHDRNWVETLIFFMLKESIYTMTCKVHALFLTFSAFTLPQKPYRWWSKDSSVHLK